MITSLAVLVVLLWITPVFKRMPQNAMGAIVIAAVPQLFNISEFVFLWRVNKFDWAVFNCAAFGVMFAGVETGLTIAIILSIVLALFKSAFPHISIMGHLEGTTAFRNMQMFPEAKELPAFLIVRIDAPLYFANINPARERIEKLQRDYEEAGKMLKFLVLDMAAVSHIDASAVHFLKAFVPDQKAKGVQVVIANPNKWIVRTLYRSHLMDIVGRDFVSVRMHDAILHCQSLMTDEERALAEAPFFPKVETHEPGIELAAV
jgi:sulfate transporter 4